jgi:hypothetical protein
MAELKLTELTEEYGRERQQVEEFAWATDAALLRSLTEKTTGSLDDLFEVVVRFNNLSIYNAMLSGSRRDN